MQLSHGVLIDAPIERVFDFVADPRNDPQWCPRVKWCEQRSLMGVVVGARFEAYEHPSLRRAQSRMIEIVSMERPIHLVSEQTDEQGEFSIEYHLATVGSGTRLEQRDRVAWTLPKLVVPIAERIVNRHIRHQLEGLKLLLELRGKE